MFHFQQNTNILNIQHTIQSVLAILFLGSNELELLLHVVSGAAMHQLRQEMAHVDQGPPPDATLFFLLWGYIRVCIMLYRLNIEQRTLSLRAELVREGYIFMKLLP